MEPDKIAVIDFGGQYAHLIARRVRQLHVFSEIFDPETPAEQLKGFKGVIFSGGPAMASGERGPQVDTKILELGVPLLGFCYGYQLLVQMAGGKISKASVEEFGKTPTRVNPKSPVFEGLNEEQITWMSHHDEVTQIPQGFEVIASTDNCRIAAVQNLEKNIFGFQFHPEVTHTAKGMKMLENFLFKVCNCQPNWKIENYLEEKVREIRQKVNDKKVFLLASGGVDSTVVLALLAKALPQEKVYALHVDTGFMRRNESSEVKAALEKLGYKNFHVVDAADYFFEKTAGLIDPEEKREAIGQAFIDVQQQEFKRMGLNDEDWLLAQGTIYPDTIETARTKHADKIKTHHNRAPIILELMAQGKVLEPIDELYKDEVRELGLKLGLPEHLVFRQPFPGPGLAIRVLCAEKEAWPELKDDVEARASAIAAKHGLKARLLPVQSVGVQGDLRTYRNPVALIGEADWPTLDKASTELTNAIDEITRVVWLLRPQDIESLKLVPGTLTRERVALCRQADAISMQTIEKHGLMKKVWQFPTILIPLAVNAEQGESIVLRPIYSLEAMTASFADLDRKIVREIVDGIKQLAGVTAVFYDITHKPPATICWE